MQKDDAIRISYEGKIKESGQVFDKTDDLVVILGAQYVLPGLEEELLKMKIGDKEKVEILPEKGFGARDAKLVKLVPLAEFRRHGQKPVPGMVVNADNARGRVLSVSGGRVRVDFNHPLAGKVLEYSVEVKEKVAKIEDKIKGIIHFFTRMETNKIEIKILGKEVEVFLPPTVHPVFKKKISDDILKYCSLEKVKFSEVFEKGEEEKEVADIREE